MKSFIVASLIYSLLAIYILSDLVKGKRTLDGCDSKKHSKVAGGRRLGREAFKGCY
jgi:hypothetical protein